MSGFISTQAFLSTSLTLNTNSILFILVIKNTHTPPVDLKGVVKCLGVGPL